MCLEAQKLLLDRFEEGPARLLCKRVCGWGTLVMGDIARNLCLRASCRMPPPRGWSSLFTATSPRPRTEPTCRVCSRNTGQ